MLELAKAIESQKIVLSPLFYERADFFTRQLLLWNKVHNLTGATTYEAVQEHIFDAVYPVSFLPAVKTVLDIGTGAGFPGLIMAMALENSHFTLVEPLQKRSAFLTYIAASLHLENVTVLGRRIQEVEAKPYDLITSRAVTNTEELLSLSQPFIAKGTLLLYFKGEQVYDEIKNIFDYRIIQAPHRNYLIIQR